MIDLNQNQPSGQGLKSADPNELLKWFIEMAAVRGPNTYAFYMKKVAENRIGRNDLMMLLMENPEEQDEGFIAKIRPATTAGDIKTTGDLKALLQSKPPQALVIWCGGNMPATSIGKYKSAVNEALIKIGEDPRATELAAKAVADTAYPVDSRSPVPNRPNQLLQSQIQKQLDQEVEFYGNVILVEDFLRSIGITPVVYRPSSDLFLNRSLAYIKRDWKMFKNLMEIKCDFNAPKTILVTMGHGDNNGSTQFVVDGVLSQTAIASALNIGRKNEKDLFYIPLQCFPSAAVRAGTAQHWTSISVDSQEEIVSSQISSWLEKPGLSKALASWYLLK